jgi:hypothetical protein
MKAKRKQAKSMTTSHSKDQYTAIFNSTSSISSSNYNSNPPGQWTIGDHTTTNTTLKVDGTIEVKGRDILKELDEMRDALLLLKRDVDMETKYPKLKELKDAYERQLEKYKTFEALK